MNTVEYQDYLLERIQYHSSQLEYLQQTAMSALDAIESDNESDNKSDGKLWLESMNLNIKRMGDYVYQLGTDIHNQNCLEQEKTKRLEEFKE